MKSPRSIPAALVLAGAAGAMGGCLERRIAITSEPDGAIVWINDQEVGRTPVDTGFTFYGTYDVRVRKEGYEPVSGPRDAVAPWYEYPGPDLVASALPIPIRSTVRWHYVLSPLPPNTDEARTDLVERAEALRERLGPTPTMAP